MGQYRSGRALVTALTALVATRLISSGVSVLGWLVIVDGGDQPLRIAAARAADTAAMVGLLAFLAAVVVFLVWVHRATANLRALGSESLRLSTPSRAVWGFFVPFLNLVHGHQVMATLWTESQPVPLDEHSLRRKTTLVSWWWGAYLVSSFAAYFYPDKIAHGELVSAAVAVCLIDVTRIVAGVLFLWMVRATQRRQEDQWRDFELRAAVPLPTAEGLR